MGEMPEGLTPWERWLQRDLKMRMETQRIRDAFDAEQMNPCSEVRLVRFGDEGKEKLSRCGRALQLKEVQDE